MVAYLPERFLIDLGESVSGLLLSHEGVRVIVLRPTLRTRPSTYKSDMIQVQVGLFLLVHFCVCAYTPITLSSVFAFQSHLAALSLGDPRVRVCPHFAMDTGMLSSNGSTMTSAASSKFREFVLEQLLDALAYFEMRRVPLEITIDENSNETVRKLPLTPGAFDSSLGLPESYSTPGTSSSSSSGVPRSGPCYLGSSGPVSVLAEGASTAEIVHAVNLLYEEFRDKCIKDNHILANQLDVNDGKTNQESATRVCLFFPFSFLHF